MIKVLAIDDEPLALQQLSSYIRRIPFLELCGECQSAHDAQAIMEQTQIDAVFSDINMPDCNGLDFVRSLPEPPIIVFTTAYSGYAVEGYKVSAADFLLKPFGFDEFQTAANKVKRRFDLLHPSAAAEEKPEEEIPSEERLSVDDSIFLKTEHRMVRVNVADIKYIEGMSEYLKIHLLDGSRPIVILWSMKKVEERLPTELFLRIHRSYLVNVKAITEVNRNRVFLGHDTSLPIGVLFKDAVRQYVESKFLGK